MKRTALARHAVLFLIFGLMLLPAVAVAQSVPVVTRVARS